MLSVCVIELVEKVGSDQVVEARFPRAKLLVADQTT